MNVNDKIKQILIDKSLSPSVFADEIGVQRSSISHILSGRNRPSFDIIQKVIRRYPDLGYDWIMETDDDSQENAYPVRSGATIRPPCETNQANTTRATVSPVDHRRTQLVGTSVSTNTNLNQPGIPTVSESPVAVVAKEKTVERILIFYTDGTFREYTPAG